MRLPSRVRRLCFLSSVTHTRSQSAHGVTVSFFGSAQCFFWKVGTQGSSSVGASFFLRSTSTLLYRERTYQHQTLCNIPTVSQGSRTRSVAPHVVPASPNHESLQSFRHGRCLACWLLSMQLDLLSSNGGMTCCSVGREVYKTDTRRRSFLLNPIFSSSLHSSNLSLRDHHKTFPISQHVRYV